MANSYYRQITFDHTQVPSNQTNIPMLITGTIASLKTVSNGGHVQSSSGYDIIISLNNDESSPLDFERVWWSPTTGAFEIWVKIPTLSSSADTIIYMCYGDSGITTDQSNPTLVWDSNYVGVFHMGSPTSLSVTDTTGNITMNNQGSPSAANGLIGGGFQSDGSTIYSKSSVFGSGAPWPSGDGARTFETWFLAGSATQVNSFIGGIGNSQNTGQGWRHYWYNPSGTTYQLSCDEVNQGLNETPIITPDTSNWHFLATSCDGSSNSNADPPISWYRDGSTRSVSASGGTFNTDNSNNAALSFCAAPGSGGPGTLFNGTIDEVRVSKIQRSTDWLTSQYNNVKPSASTPTIGGEIGVGVINQTLSDTFSFRDSESNCSRTQCRRSGYTSRELGDAVIFNTGIPALNLSDDFSSLWMDVLAIGINYYLPFTESFTFVDGSPAMNMMAFGDQFSFTDSQGILVAVVQSLSDTFTFSDAVKVVALCDVLLSDTFTWSDSVGYSVPFNRSFSDFFIWRDAQVVKWSSVLPALTDQLMLSDSVTVALLPFWTPINLSFNESLNLSDSTNEQGLIPFTFSDTLIFSDIVMVADTFNPFNQLLTDAFTFNDVVLISVSGRMLQFADSFQFSDSVFVQNYTSFNSYIRRYLNDEPDV